MAEEVGLKARLSLRSAEFQAGMRRASGSFVRLRQSAALARAGIRNVSAGFSGLRRAALVVAGAGALSIRTFLNFEKQMGAVKAAVGEANRKFFPALSKRASELGATTQFTSVQVAAAMEQLALAGLTPQQVLEGIGTVLDGAAAGGLKMAEAAKILVANMGAFGLKTTDATRIMDTFAFVARTTKVTIADLQQGMSLVGATAKQSGVPFREVVAALGALNDVGIESTRAGTVLNQALTQLAVKSKKGAVSIGGTRVAITKADGTFRSLQKIFSDVNIALEKFPSRAKRIAILSKLLNVRGAKAALAFSALGQNTEKNNKLFRDFTKLSKGASAEMRRLRTENPAGDIVRLASAFQEAQKQIGGALFAALRPTVLEVTKFFGGITKGTPLVKQFALGIKEGIGAAKEVFADMFSTFKGVLGLFSLGSSSVKDLVKNALKIGAVIVKWKIYASVLSRIGKIAFGVGQITKALVISAGGIVGAIAARVPALGKLSGVVGKLAGKVSGIEKITAQPVRVVNFSEIGGVAGRVDPRQLQLFGDTRKGLTGLREGLGASVGKLGRFGGFLNAGAFSLKDHTSKLGKAGAALGKVGLAGAALGLGAAFGTLLDRTFGLSDKFSQMAFETGKNTLQQSKTAIAARASNEVLVRSADQFKSLNNLIKLQRKFGGVQLTPGAARVTVTRQLAEKRVRESIRRDKLTQEQTASILAILKPTLDKLPDAVAKGARAGISGAKLTVNTSSVNKDIAGQRQETAARGGFGTDETIAPGARGRAARGA